MEQEEQKLNSLPDNAYRELKPGEVYKPIMPANSKPREVTTYSVVFGIIMAIVFSAAAAYLGLKVGQVFEAAIPIAIIAVGCGNLMKKNNMSPWAAATTAVPSAACTGKSSFLCERWRRYWPIWPGAGGSTPRSAGFFWLTAMR